MKKLLKPFFLLFTVCTIMGCIPYSMHDYYSPNASDGVLRKSHCYGASGPPSVIELKRDDVIIKASILEKDSGLSIFLRLDIPKGKTVRLDSSTIRVSSPSNTITSDGTLSAEMLIAEPPWKIELKPTESMVGDTRKSNICMFGPCLFNNTFDLTTTLTMKKSDTVIVHLPIFIINEKNVQLPDIIFKKDRYLEILPPINC
jgi:hypothetical protein